MTVSELIRILENMPQDMDVVVENGDFANFIIEPRVRRVTNHQWFSMNGEPDSPDISKVVCLGFDSNHGW